MFPPLTVWSNFQFDPPALRTLRRGLGRHRLEFARALTGSVHATGQREPGLAHADIALGQPEPAEVLATTRLRWLQLTSAGYTRYSENGFMPEVVARGLTLTNSSHAIAESCAQHVLAMMLAVTRQLPESLRTQLSDQMWRYDERRNASMLLCEQVVVLLGFGAIAARLVELLAPFGVQIGAVRRRKRGDEAVPILTPAALPRWLARADHVVDLLPENATTRHYVDARFIRRLKRGAAFYNIGRGATVDQPALLAALRSGHIGAAYLDVTDPEPLPRKHPLWTAPRCYLTPHTGGGHRSEQAWLVRHFLANLAAFERGQPLVDRIA